MSLRAVLVAASLLASAYCIAQPPEVLANAETALKNTLAKFNGDPARPEFHFRAPALWMNDPNGPAYYRGWYHMFYQFNPYGDGWGHMHWGHARSRDLVNWDHLPIALGPSEERGEEHVFSGCFTVDAQGRPLIFYTSIAKNKSAGNHAEQWVASGSGDLKKWQKLPNNPILSEALHGPTKMFDWRDPFIFKQGKRTFLVAGGHTHDTKDHPVVNLYEAENGSLEQWRYRGVLFEYPDSDVGNIECPNFFPLDGKWVLVISPHNRVQYFTGTFDPDAGKFVAEHRGLVDYSRNYYAPNGCFDGGKRFLEWGWINGFPGGKGWNGCLTLPRVLHVAKDGSLRQEIAPELKKLREKPVSISKRTALTASPTALSSVSLNQAELEGTFLRGDAASFGLILRDGNNEAVRLSFDATGAAVNWESIPDEVIGDTAQVPVRVFIDRSLVEVFIGDRAAWAGVIRNEGRPLSIELFSDGGTGAEFTSAKLWPLKSTWPQPKQPSAKK